MTMCTDCGRTDRIATYPKHKAPKTPKVKNTIDKWRKELKPKPYVEPLNYTTEVQHEIFNANKCTKIPLQDMREALRPLAGRHGYNTKDQRIDHTSWNHIVKLAMLHVHGVTGDNQSLQ